MKKQSYYRIFELGVGMSPRPRYITLAATVIMDINAMGFTRGDAYKMETITNGSIISVGMSTCMPEDEYDKDLGKKIAEGKAMKNSVLSFITKGRISKYIIKSMLAGIEQDVKNNPGEYIGYFKKH